MRTWIEGEMFEKEKPRRRRLRFVVEKQRARTKELGTAGSGIFDAESAASKTGVLAQLQSLIVGLGARGIKDQNAESVTRPAVVAKEALEAGFFDACLFVDGGDRAGHSGSRSFAQARVVSLGTAQDGIDERDTSGAKVQSSDGAAIAGLQERLEFRGSKKQFVRAVGVVVEHFDARRMRAGSEAVGDGFRTDEIACGIGAEMRSVDSPEDAVPVGIVALRAQEEVACFRKLGGLFFSLLTGGRGSRSDARGNAQHLFVQKVGLGKFAKKAPPRAAAQEGQHFRARSEFLKHGVIALAHARGENPLHHFGVGSGGKIGAAQGRMRSEIFARSADAEPIRVFLQCGKKIGEPA